jgi:hypothetical protein
LGGDFRVRHNIFFVGMQRLEQRRGEAAVLPSPVPAGMSAMLVISQNP